MSHPADTVSSKQMPPANPPEGTMRIDCSECVMQGTVVCRDCVVSHLLVDTDGAIELDQERSDALSELAGEGLVPRLRLIRRVVNE
jgi:hypothetical protein